MERPEWQGCFLPSTAYSDTPFCYHNEVTQAVTVAGKNVFKS
jgi:hypothetical protein